jgi:hypothetical protein
MFGRLQGLRSADARARRASVTLSSDWSTRPRTASKALVASTVSAASSVKPSILATVCSVRRTLGRAAAARSGNSCAASPVSSSPSR